MNKKTLSLIGLFALVITSLVTSISAASQASMNVTIPFSFKVGSRTLPAGRYSLSGNNMPGGVVLLQSREQHANAGCLTIRRETNKIPARSSLEFHRYGEQYFLSRIWSEGSGVFYELPTSRSEREAASQAKHLAGNRVPPEIVAITAE